MNHYIVSARKYRPTTFDSVVGQSTLTTTLKNAIAQGKLAHAYLFCGPRGVGKTTCARIFAKTINCLNPTPKGEACNACESCVAFNEQRSYNIHELDAASNNSVEDIRGLIEQVQIPPQVGRYKVFIIDEVHMLSTAAFNAFLKTLEEPPAHAIFVLATTEKHKILPTILSRCQIYDFARITVADTVAHLANVAQKEGITYEPEALHVIAEKADGGMRDALSIFDQVTSYCEGNITYAKVIEDLNVLDYDTYFAMTDALLKPNIPEAMVQLNNVLTKGFEANYFVGGLASHLRNLLMCRDEQTLPLLDVSEQVRTRYHEQAKRCEPKWLYRALKLCNNCDMHYATARNKRLLVEITLIEVAQATEGTDDDSCGRGPAQRLKPLFNKIAAAIRPQQSVAAVSAAANAQNAAAAPIPAPVSNASALDGKAMPTAQVVQPVATNAQPAAPKHELPDFLKSTVDRHPEIAQNNQNTLNMLSSAAARSAQYQQRPVQSLSIKGTLSSIRARNAQTTQQTSQPAAVQSTSQDEKLSNPFNDDRLTYYWFRYAQQLPQEKAALMGRMKSMKPTVNPQTWQVSVMVENEMVEEYMHKEQVSLTNYLRTQLRNDYITIKLSITPSSVKRAFTRRERFMELLQKYPAVEMLRQEFDLELS